MTVCCGASFSVLRIMPNIDSGCLTPSIVNCGIEDLVAAMFAVGLREHHQLDVGRVALELAEGLDEVVHLVIGQRQAEVGVRSRQGVAARCQHIHLRHRLGLTLVEQVPRGVALEGHALGHAVMQGHRGGLQLVGDKGLLPNSPPLVCRRNSVTRSRRWTAVPPWPSAPQL